jgi:hypothetical protein
MELARPVGIQPRNPLCSGYLILALPVPSIDVERTGAKAIAAGERRDGRLTDETPDIQDGVRRIRPGTGSGLVGLEPESRIMRRAALRLIGPVGFAGLLIAIYRPVLLGGEQFAYGNAAYFYYPLYLKVQEEWNAGRWPLWNPAQNGGEPLLGNPMAAVLYPGKALYAVLPYAWAARLYVIAHSILAFLGVRALARTCGLSRVGSNLGGLSYAFGAPILLLYSNVIFLVGAAWAPWGLRAIDRLLRQGHRLAIVELAAVMAMQVLGGDPEAAYLTALSGAGYAVIRAISNRDRPARFLTWPVIGGTLAVWTGATLGAAYVGIVPIVEPATRWLVLATWLAAGLAVVWRWRMRPQESRLAPLLARLAAACILALALAAGQVLPVAEFAAQSWRASGFTESVLYDYSLNPCRIVELFWPSVFGMSAPENRSWLAAISPMGDQHLWVNSLYVGSLILVLAASAWGFRSGPPWRAWLTAITLVTLAASLGKHGSPLWWARWGPLESILGPHDPPFGEPRADLFLSDGTGSPYGLLALLLPGFRTFRYPSKLFTFTTLGLAVLAAAGWDRMVEGRDQNRGLRHLGLAGVAVSLLALLATLMVRGAACAFLSQRVAPDPMFGPTDLGIAWAETQRALAHGAMAFAAIAALAHWAPRHRHGAGALAVSLLAVDLAVANARLICTVPQAEFDAPSQAARLIAVGERSDPSPGPFRIHRMTGWYPLQFASTRSRGRLSELIAWARDSLCPLFALPAGLDYCSTVGFLELDDYLAFFHPEAMPLPTAMARVLGAAPGQTVVYFPRRSFDLWGARYFLVPAWPDWTSRERGYASFLDSTELIYPAADVLYDRRRVEGREPWAFRSDWQLRRNRAVYPRAWVVHSARVRSPEPDPAARARSMRSLVYMKDPIWSERDRPVVDLRQTALIETDDKEGLSGFLSLTTAAPSESVTVLKHEPQNVELLARLERPGLVILADTFYPGWRLKIDGKPAHILRANRLMRGAAVPAGRHTLTYTFDPLSFRIGSIVSAGGLVVLVILLSSSIRSQRQDARRTPGASGPSPPFPSHDTGT